MDDSHILRAMRIAIVAHEGQVDKQGNAYILHPVGVMLLMDTVEEQVCAVLHDVLEDSHAYSLMYLTEWFGESVGIALGLLTHDKKQDTYTEYIHKVSEDSLAARVKIADLTHNMSKMDSLAEIDPHKAESLSRRYQRALKYLEAR